VSPHSNGGEPQNIAAAVADISERASVLVREEIELAKAELTEKTTKIAKGAAVGAIAGIFFVWAVLFLLIGLAWLLYYYLPGNQFTYFWGFFAVGLILIALGVAAGLIAARALKRGAPPVPTMAIEEAQKIRETVAAQHSSPPVPPGAPIPPVPPSATAAPVPAPPAGAGDEG
jgi:Putative Actinobacterial Holin-X, holin superfamily III